MTEVENDTTQKMMKVVIKKLKSQGFSDEQIYYKGHPHEYKIELTEEEVNWFNGEKHHILVDIVAISESEKIAYEVGNFGDNTEARVKVLTSRGFKVHHYTEPRLFLDKDGESRQSVE